MLHVVLYEPEIPQNTGNVVRTCAAAGAMLHLIEPLGFSLADRYLKRAGLDYWDWATIRVHPDFPAFRREFPDLPLFLFTTKGAVRHTDVRYPEEAALVFGRETRGLPEAMLRRMPQACVRLPMRPGIRSMNLSNTVAVAVFEALRQRDFAGLETQGHLTGRDDEEPWMDGCLGAERGTGGEGA